MIINGMVYETKSSISTIEELQEYVYGTICSDHELLTDAFPKSSTYLRRRGEICGIMFCVQGPRTVAFTAIWEKQKNRVFFFDPTGERYRLTDLGKTPDGAFSFDS